MQEFTEDYGSGYPSGNVSLLAMVRLAVTILKGCFRLLISCPDPTTKKWLVENKDHVFGYPQFVRFSWSTCSVILDDKAVPVHWLV